MPTAPPLTQLSNVVYIIFLFPLKMRHAFGALRPTLGRQIYILPIEASGSNGREDFVDLKG